MFWKKTCNKCGKKVEKGFSYCPHCGYSIDKEKEERDYGFLGKGDDIDIFRNSLNNEIKLPLGFNMVFKKLIKGMDKQFRELDKELGKEKIEKMPREKFLKSGGISINISSGEGAPVIKVKSFGDIPEFREMAAQIKPGYKPSYEEEEKDRKTKIKQPISEEKAKELAKLPRQEAESKVRRLSGKVIYEIELPGVKNIKDVIVNQLENSIEVKAFAKDKAYFKFLPVSLPLLNYRLSDNKLILELGEK